MRAWVGRRYPRDEQGAIAILTALLMVALTVCAAIVVDLGLARDVRRQSQNAGDAAALAGAAALYPVAIPPAPPTCQSGGAPPCKTDAADAAKLYALKNFQVSTSDWATCTAALPSGYVASASGSCISYDATTTKVRVVVPTRTIPTFFGGITGRTSIPLGSSAEGLVVPAVSCSLCFLGSVDAGNADFTANGGSIAVNGSLSAQPNSVWTSQSNGVVGAVSGGQFSTGPTTILPFGDPLAGLTMPITTGLTSKTNPCTQGPGLYSGSFNDLPSASCTLQPGLYVVSGNWGMKNNDKLMGTGVTLYVTGSGALDFKNGDVNITAPATGSPNAGYAIIYGPANTNDLGLQGNGNTSINGAVYAPKSKMNFNGNSCFGFKKGPVVVLGVIKANGNKSCVKIDDAVDIEVSAKGLRLDK